MARPEGLPKTGGRKKGTPNRKTNEVEAALKSHGIDVVAKLCEIMPALSMEKQAEILMSLMNFLYPKRKAVEIKEDEQANQPQVVLYLPAKDEEEIFENAYKPAL